MTSFVLDFPDLPVADPPDDRYAFADQLAARLQDLEQIVRWCEAEMITVLDHADRLGVYSLDGHRNIRSWGAANMNWSNRESLDRARTVTLVREVPEIATELTNGAIGIAQVRELARVRANPRCGEQITDAAAELVELAKSVSFDEFRSVTQQWEQLNDTDGAHAGHEAAHDGRRVTTSTLGDTFHLGAQFGAIQGAAISEILKRFEHAQFDAEWADLNARFGDDACTSMLERTNSQRRADALFAMCQAAVSAPVGCVRRVVMNAAGVVIDLSRKQRLFTGASRTAVFLQEGRRCIWPGCGRDYRTEIDHSTDWQHEGVTAPCNGGPLCRWHNLFKNQGYHVIRDEIGHWHTYRPDWSEIRPI